MLRSFARAVVFGAVALTTGCAGATRYKIHLADAEVRDIQQRTEPFVLTTDEGRVLTTEKPEVLEVRFEQSRAAWGAPTTLKSALKDVHGPAVVMLRHEAPRYQTLSDTGKYTAMGGGVVGGVGLVVLCGAVLIAGPANDTAKGGRVGVVMLGTGAGVALIGGVMYLFANANSPAVPVDLGQARVSPGVLR